VPEWGPGYTEYYLGKISRFLASMPACPICGNHAFDRFVNNAAFPRFQSGKELSDDFSNADILEQNGVAIYLLE
jgi:hypothetical protein